MTDIVQPNGVGEVVQKIMAEFFDMDEDQSKRFVLHFGSRKAKHPIKDLVKLVRSTVWIDEETKIIEAETLVLSIHPEDQPLAKDLIKFVAEYVINNPSQFKASKLSAAQFRAMLIRRMFQAGFKDDSR